MTREDSHESMTRTSGCSGYTGSTTSICQLHPPSTPQSNSSTVSVCASSCGSNKSQQNNTTTTNTTTGRRGGGGGVMACGGAFSLVQKRHSLLANCATSTDEDKKLKRTASLGRHDDNNSSGDGGSASSSTSRNANVPLNNTMVDQQLSDSYNSEGNAAARCSTIMVEMLNNPKKESVLVRSHSENVVPSIAEVQQHKKQQQRYIYYQGRFKSVSVLQWPGSNRIPLHQRHKLEAPMQQHYGRMSLQARILKGLESKKYKNLSDLSDTPIQLLPRRMLNETKARLLSWYRPLNIKCDHAAKENVKARGLSTTSASDHFDKSERGC